MIERRNSFVRCARGKVRMLSVGFLRMIVMAALAIMLSISLFPSSAFAYYNRGSVSVSLGVSSLEVAAGESVDVSMSFSPAADSQTEGCGMAKCPQNCAASCQDENGQCRCSGTDYTTYYPTAVATSSNPAVAVAVCRNGVLTIYGRAEGEADIAVQASLRQFTDGETSIHVTVRLMQVLRFRMPPSSYRKRQRISMIAPM